MLHLIRWLAALPDRFLYVLASVLAFLLFDVSRYRRETVDANLLRAFPGKSVSERRRLAKAFYCHLADVVVETLMLSRMTREQLDERVDVVGVEQVSAHVQAGRSVILLSAHQGNWEWMLSAMAAHLPCPMDGVYRPLHQPAMEHFFRQARTRFGAHLIPAEQAARAILKLRREVRAFGIIGDQNPRRKDNKHWATFMEVDTPVAVGPERIARLTGYPLFFVSMEKLARGRYRCVVSPLLQPPYDVLAEGEISRCYMAAVEAQVRQQPDGWMWSHQRWRYRREDTPEYLAARQANP